MATNTAGTTARQLPFQAVHYLRCNLSETSPLTGTIGILPAGAVILSAVSGAYVHVVFSGGNPTVDIGTERTHEQWGMVREINRQMQVSPQEDLRDLVFDERVDLIQFSRQRSQ